MHFRRAQPPGCRPAGEHDGGWWCEITSDGGIAVRNVERLREVVRSAEKRAAERTRRASLMMFRAKRRRVAANSSPAAPPSPPSTPPSQNSTPKTPNASAAVHLPAPVRPPARVAGSTRSSAARTEPARTSRRRDVVCTVTSSARVAPESSSADATTQGSNPTGVDASDESQCDELLAWRAKYEEEDAEGKPEFWRWLSRRHSHLRQSRASTRTRHGRGRHGHGKDSRGDRIQGGQGVQGAESRDAPR